MPVGRMRSNKVFQKSSYSACHCEPVTDVTGVAIRFPPAFPWGGAPRSELKSNNCQWQLLHNVKVARASPASARRMRATCLSPWERCPAGVERACLPSQSLRDSSPRVGAKGRTDCDRRESLERTTPVCGSSQRHAFFASALKTERYRAVPNSQSNIDQPAHALNAASCRYSAFRFSTSSATFRERMTLYLS